MKLNRTRIRPTLLLVVIVVVYLLVTAMSRHKGNVPDSNGAPPPYQYNYGNTNYAPNQGRHANGNRQMSYEQAYYNGSNGNWQNSGNNNAANVQYYSPNQIVNGNAGNYTHAPPPAYVAPNQIAVHQQQQLAYMARVNHPTVAPPQQFYQQYSPGQVQYQQNSQGPIPYSSYPQNNQYNNNAPSYNQQCVQPPSFFSQKPAEPIQNHQNSYSTNPKEQIPSSKLSPKLTPVEDKPIGLFMNPALIPTTAGEVVFVNKDGYEQKITVHGKDTNVSKENGTEKRPSLSQSESSAAESSQNIQNLLELSPMSSVSVENSLTPEQANEPNESEDSRASESVGKPSNLFNGIDFPNIPENSVPSDAQEDYKQLKKNMEIEIEKFFEKHPDCANSSQNSAATVVSNMKDYVQLEDQPASFYLNDKDGPVEVDLFVPISSILELEKGIRRARIEKNSQLSAIFEKKIQNTLETVKFERDGIKINLKKEELEQLQEMFRQGRQATIIMYSEFPQEENGSDEEFYDANGTSGTSNDGAPSTSALRTSPRRTLPVPPQTRSSRYSDFTNNGASASRERATSSRVDYTYRPRQPEMNVLEWSDEPGPSNRPVPEPSPETPFGNEINDTFQGHRLKTYQEILAERENSMNYWNFLRKLQEIAREEEERASDPPPRHKSIEPRMRLNPEHDTEENGNKIPPSELITFIIPTRIDLFAQVPFKPWRMPLIGVARRAQGVNYTPKRFLPGHKACYRRDTTETEEDSNDASINRDIGPLTLEPRGYLFATPVELERLEQRYRAFMAAYEKRNARKSETKEGNQPFVCNKKKNNNFPGPVLPFNDEGASASLSQPLSDKENEKKTREAAESCRTESSSWSYNGDFDDDDENDSHQFSGASSSSCTKHNPTFSSGSSHTSGDQEKTSHNTSRNTGRPVRDTAWKNQKKREKDIQRAQRKKEEEERLQKQRVKKEAKEAKLLAAQERKRIEEERLAAEKAIEEQKKKEAEEEQKKNDEIIKGHKRKIMNQFNKDRKRRIKQERYEAKKFAEEEAEKKVQAQIEIARRVIDPVIQSQLDIAKINLEKSKLRRKIDNRSESESEFDEYECEVNELSPEEKARLRAFIEPTLEQLAKHEHVDTSSIKNRCGEISFFFDSDPHFLKYRQKHTCEGNALNDEVAKGMCSWREYEFIKMFEQDKNLNYARIARQYQYWQENMYEDLSMFINYCLTRRDPYFPTIETLEMWLFFDEEQRIETMESTL